LYLKDGLNPCHHACLSNDFETMRLLIAQVDIDLNWLHRSRKANIGINLLVSFYLFVDIVT